MQKQEDIGDLIEMLFREIQELTTIVKEQQIEISELKERLSDYETKKNSNNSSKPPSSDIGNIKKTKSLKRSSGKNVGGQLGHKGSSLKMVSNPDIIEKHHPNFCTCCGNDLSSIESIFLGKRQVIDIPKIEPNVTEYQVFQKTCTCGNVEKANYQTGVDAPISYGKNTQALLAYLSTRQYIPYKRLEEVLQSVFGLGICQASVKNILSKLSSKLEPVYEEIRQTVINYSVLGADETSVNINGKNHWAWTFQTPNATFIDIHPKRGYDAIKEIMFEGFSNSIIVSDCWSSYFKTDAKSHQLCTAHILRELEYLNERYKQQTWSSRLAKLIRIALHLRKTDNLSSTIVLKITRKLEELIEENTNVADKKIIALRKRLRKYKDYLFLFLDNPLVPPDNNASERAIRNFKVKQKISGYFKTEQGAKNYAIFQSVCDTAIKNKQNPLFALQAATII